MCTHLKTNEVSLIHFKEMHFVGYGDFGEMRNQLWDLEANQIVCSHDVVFNENKVHMNAKEHY